MLLLSASFVCPSYTNSMNRLPVSYGNSMKGAETSLRAPSGTAMVATSHPLAVNTAVEILRDGGNAVDAAVAAAATLCVVDPRSVGIGGDAFATIWQPSVTRPIALMAAGPAPASLTLESLKEAGLSNMPKLGPWTVTVPGAVAGWELALRDHGTVGLDRVLRDAIDISSSGFEVTRWVAEEWASNEEKLRGNEAASLTFLPTGAAPKEGDMFANPRLSDSLRFLADEGGRAFYRGPLAERIAAAVQELGGPLKASDLHDWAGPTWEEPLTARWESIDVYVPPPPGQGISLLEAIGIYAGFAPETHYDEEHLAIESLKVALADAAHHVADPAFESVRSQHLLSDALLTSRRETIRLDQALRVEGRAATDTVYVAVIDGNGMSCSWIQSLYEGFGSGIVVPDTGIALQNRGANFVMDPAHPNRPAPGKRPYHTIVPTTIGNEGYCMGCLGVVGGFMQPQGQFQILREVFMRGVDPQEAISKPRFRVRAGFNIGVEPGYDRAIAAELERRGHRIVQLDRFDAGGAQMIVRSKKELIGASDPRKDGLARRL